MWSKISAAIAIALVLVLCVIARDQSSSFQTCVSEQHSGYQQQVEGPSAIVVPIFQAWPISIKCTGRFIDKANAAITAFATFVIAVFTIVLVAVSRTQTSLTRESLVADKRAFVHSNGIDSYYTFNEKTRQYDWHFRIKWQNSGSTPTRNMTMFAECEVRTALPPANFDFITPTVSPAKAFIGPQSTLGGGLIPTPGRPPISPEDILDAQANRRYIYVWGWVKYNDVFPGTPQHVTRVCWLIAALGDPRAFVPGTEAPRAGSLTFPSIHHTEGNCADEECQI